MMPELRRLVRMAAVIEQIGQRSGYARSAQAAGDHDAAQAAYREALELCAGAGSGFPEPAREHVLSLLALEDRLWQDDARPEGESTLAALLAPDNERDALSAVVAVPLRGWWKLARRAADLAYIEAQITLGDYGAATARVTRRITEQPDDPESRALYARCLDDLLGRVLRGLRRRLDRAARLAADGAYADALAELDRIETSVLAPYRPNLPDIDHREMLEPALEEAADLRLRLVPLQAIAARLEPLVEQAREATLAGRFDEALAALAQAEVIDPHRGIGPTWMDLDSLATLAARAAASTRPNRA